MLLKDTIKKLEDRFGKQIPIDELRKEMKDIYCRLIGCYRAQW